MRTVRICIELEEETYRAFEAEAGSRGVSVEALVEQTVRGLLDELEQDERNGTDHPIVFP